ncbi:MAG TPA: hypothetical protein VFI11_05475 [Anaerolineales bacterium]|nr:hypothetical protein [Anaerolineales bacterium]
MTLASLAALLVRPGPSGVAFHRESGRLGQPEPSIEVRSVPALPGLEFRLFRPCSLYIPPGRSAADYCFSGEVPEPESWTFTANDQGIARLEGPAPGLYHLQVRGWEASSAKEKAEFGRWEDDVFTPERPVVLTSGLQLVVGMNILRQIHLEFRGPAEDPISAGRVSSVVVRSSFGSFLTLEGEGPHWVLAERSLRRDAGLESVLVVYAVQRVVVDGGNVVNRGQLRLVAEPGTEAWTLPLLLYSARIEPRDALFGGPVAGNVVLEYPDGRREELPAGNTGTVEVPDLARGNYRVWVEGGLGIVLPTIMVLSRDQIVRPPVITYLDLGVLLGGGLGLILGLLFAGRPYLLLAARERLARSVSRTARQVQGEERPSA